MGPLDAFWHLLNFFAPALVVGLLTACAAKLIWRRSLSTVTWTRLCAWGCVSSGVALIGALVVFGRDGKMAGYALMVSACALGLWGATLRDGSQNRSG